MEREKEMINIIEIHDFSAPELDIYARWTENQLLNRKDPANAMFIAESPKVIQTALDAGYEPISCLVEKKHVEGQAALILAQCGDIPVYTAEFDVLTQLTGFGLTRGMLCVMRRKGLPSVEDVCKNARRIAILEDVMNPTNVGGNFPFSGGSGNGWYSSDISFKQSSLSSGHPCEYGNRFSDSLDVYG